MGVRETAREILGRNFPFKDMAEADLDRLASLAHARHFAAEQAVFEQGDDGSTLMAVESGRVRICTYHADGRERVYNLMVPGDVFGEIAALDGGQRTASAYADVPTTLLIISRRDLIAFLEQTPSASSRLIQILCHRLRWLSEQVEALTFLDLRSRLAKWLLHLADTTGQTTPTSGEVEIRVTQDRLARLMGNTRQAVNRQLGAFEEENLIRNRRGVVIITDTDGLVKAAESEV